jgi:gluconokinase
MSVGGSISLQSKKFLMGRHKATIAPNNSQGPFILAIDIGTSAVKILLFDRQGRAVEEVQARDKFKIRTTTDGASVVDADGLLEIVWQGIDRTLAKAGELAQKIVGVASCTFVGNILGVDQKGRPLTPVFTYADTRAEKVVGWLQAEFDENEVHDRTGCHFHSSYLPARFRWLSRTQPDLTRQAARWLSIGEYMDLKLFGEAATSYSIASWSGLLDRYQLIWDEPLVAKLPIDIAQLSPLVDMNLSKQGLHPEFASRWPELGNVPWFPAIGDGAAANIGSGCTSASRVAITMGSTTAIRAVVDKAIDNVPHGLWCYRVDGQRSLPGGATSEGGNLFTWMADTFQLGDPSDLEPIVARLQPDGHGLTVLPFLSGERSPGWQGYAKATIHGLSLATSPEEILRAGMEAVAYRVKFVFDKLVELLSDDLQIVAGGGALQNSPTWLQIITDVLGREVAVTGISETSARGTALLAFEALGMIKDLNEIPDFIENTYLPDSERHAIYRRALKRQERLYEKLVKHCG